MQRKSFGDPVVLFASPPDLNDLCSVQVRVESRSDGGCVTTQPKILKCRELIFTEPDVIATPSYEKYDCFTVVMTQSLYKTGRLQARMKKNGLQPDKPMRVYPGLYQACLRYTLLARLAPAWNKTGDWLIQGRDFLSYTGCANAVRCEVIVQTNQLFMSVCASVLRLSPLQLVDLNLSQLEMQSLLYNAEHGNGELALHSAWCHVVPSMKKARMCSISLSIPESSPFNCYRDIKRHWKNTYGFRLPETDDDIFYAQISFFGMGGKQFTYPNICLRGQPLQCVPRVDPKSILSAFLQDVHSKLPTACGHLLRFQPQMRYTLPAVYPASQDVQGPGANLSKRSINSSQLPLRNPRDIIHLRVAASQPVLSHISTIEASAAQIRSPAGTECRTQAQSEDFVVGPLTQPMSQSQATFRTPRDFEHRMLQQTQPQPVESWLGPMPQTLPQSQVTAGFTGAATWSQIVRPPVNSHGSHPIASVSCDLPSACDGEKSFENCIPATPVMSTMSCGDAKTGDSVNLLSTSMRPKGCMQRSSLSLHKPSREQTLPFSGKKNSSPVPPHPSLGDNSAMQENSQSHQLLDTESLAFTPSAFRSEPQELLATSQIIFPTPASQDSQKPHGKTTEKTSSKSITDSHGLKADSSKTVPALVAGKIVPVFRPMPHPGSKMNKTPAEEAGMELFQRTDKGTRIVPVFRPKVRTTAAPKPSSQGQKRTMTSKDFSQSLVSCPQVTSTTDLGGIPTPTQQLCFKGPAVNPHKPFKHQNTKSPRVGNSHCTKSLSSNPSPNTVAGKLKKKMLQSMDSENFRTSPGSKAAKVAVKSWGGALTQTLSPAPGANMLAIAMSQNNTEALTLTPGVTLTSTPTRLLGSQEKRKWESVAEDGVEGSRDKKARSKPHIQDVDVESLARVDQLQKVNTVTLISWLREHGVHCKAKDKKADLVEMVKVFLAIKTSEP